jgi:hypothetical protein
MGKIEVYSSSDTTTRTILTTQEDKKIYAPLYNEFRTYLSGITVERQDTGVHICGVDSAYMNMQAERKDLLTPDKEGCVDMIFDDLDNFF